MCSVGAPNLESHPSDSLAGCKKQFLNMTVPIVVSLTWSIQKEESCILNAPHLPFYIIWQHQDEKKVCIVCTWKVYQRSMKGICKPGTSREYVRDMQSAGKLRYMHGTCKGHARYRQATCGGTCKVHVKLTGKSCISPSWSATMEFRIQSAEFFIPLTHIIHDQLVLYEFMVHQK